MRMQDVIPHDIYLPGVLNQGTAESKEVMSKHLIRGLNRFMCEKYLYKIEIIRQENNF